MFHFFHKRIHESVAFSAVLACAIALNVAWIDNLLISRVLFFRNFLTLNENIGPISGLYVVTAGSFFVSFFLAFVVWRGRDLAHWRSRIFWFFIASIIIFLLMSLPFVYDFKIVV
jgi:hypothetical protein